MTKPIRAAVVTTTPVSDANPTDWAEWLNILTFDALESLEYYIALHDQGKTIEAAVMWWDYELALTRLGKATTHGLNAVVSKKKSRARVAA